jgi:hypothetical protein
MCTHQCTASTNTGIYAHQVLSFSALCVAQLLQQPPSHPIRTCRCRLELANNAAPQAELLSPLFLTEAKTHAACAAFARSCRPFLSFHPECMTTMTSGTSNFSPTCSVQQPTIGSSQLTSYRPTSPTSRAHRLCPPTSVHILSTRCHEQYSSPQRTTHARVPTRGVRSTTITAAWGFY